MRERNRPLNRRAAHDAACHRLAGLEATDQERILGLNLLATKREATIALGFDPNQCETGDTHV